MGCVQGAPKEAQDADAKAEAKAKAKAEKEAAKAAAAQETKNTAKLVLIGTLLGNRRRRIVTDP